LNPKDNNCFFATCSGGKKAALAGGSFEHQTKPGDEQKDEAEAIAVHCTKSYRPFDCCK